MSAPDDSDRIEPISLSNQGFDEPPALVVVTMVADLTGQSPLEMEPLAEVIDPDALNKLFGSPADPSSSLSIAFDYCGQQVSVTPDSIKVAAPDSTER